MTETEKLKISKLRRDGLGYKKIAAALDLPVNSVKTYLRRHPANEDAAAIPDFCEMCGKPISQTPHRKHKRFCSDSCRISWWNAHPDKGGKRTLHTFTCAYCGRYISERRKRSPLLLPRLLCRGAEKGGEREWMIFARD